MEKAFDVLRTQQSQAHFGNVGAVELLIKGALQKASTRPSQGSDSIALDADDINDPGTASAEKDADPLAPLDNLYRMEEVKAKIDKLQKTWEVARRDGDEEPELGHFVFAGAPGTGKTTVARVIAKILFGLGLKPSNKIVETSGLKLTADYLGQSKTKVNEALKDAKGGVLFIDEAYNLGFGQYGKEACDTIVAAMTSEEFKDVLIVIAGYSHEIDDMLKQNVGLKSRFTNFLTFPDWTGKDCKDFFDLKATGDKFSLEDSVLDIVEDGCKQLIELDGWANGRDVTKLFEESKRNRAMRVYGSNNLDKHFTPEDVHQAVSALLLARRGPQGKKRKLGTGCNHSDDVMQFDFDSGRGPVLKKRHNVTVMDEDTQEANIPVGHDEQLAGVDEDSVRDAGVPHEIWNKLQEAKRLARDRSAKLEQGRLAYEEYLRKREREEEEARIRYQAELERIRREMESEQQAIALRLAEEQERKRKEAELEELKQREAEEARRREMMKKEEEMKQRLRQISPCPAGFNWYREGGGWRCAGGSHFVSDQQLNSQFGSYI